jgi:hypothetical protein
LQLNLFEERDRLFDWILIVTQKLGRTADDAGLMQCVPRRREAGTYGATIRSSHDGERATALTNSRPIDRSVRSSDDVDPIHASTQSSMARASA